MQDFRQGKNWMMAKGETMKKFCFWVSFMLVALVFSGNISCSVCFTFDSGWKTEEGLPITVMRGRQEDILFVPGRKGKGLYLPEKTAVSIPLPDFNTGEGTLSFWFRPDWAYPNNCANVIVEVDAAPAFRLIFRKGYPHARWGTWVTAEPAGGFSCNSHNLYTAGVWRYYAIRWSAEKKRIELLVDGDSPSRPGGSFKVSDPGKVKARLFLSGEACGAFDEIKVFDRWLEVEEMEKIEGFTRAAYLQWQKPPLGAGKPLGSTEREVTYVDPTTGETVTGVLAKNITVYNPDDMPQLPETPHTRWAKPLADGKLKVLLVMPVSFYNGLETLIREAVELWQRLDAECIVTNTFDAKLLERDYDVIIVSHQGIVHNNWKNTGWTYLSQDLRNWILNRVKSGKSGLVMFYPMNLDRDIKQIFDARFRVGSDILLRGFPTSSMHTAEWGTYVLKKAICDSVYKVKDDWFETQGNLAKNVVEVYQQGNVRAVKFNYVMGGGWEMHTGLTPDVGTNLAATSVHYDHWMALAARAVLFVAGREPQQKITDVKIAGTKWLVSLNGLKEQVFLWYRARDIWGREYLTGQVALKPAPKVEISGVFLPPRAMVELILKNRKGQVLDWYSHSVPVSRTSRISDITLSRDYYGLGDTVEGIVSLHLKQEGQYRLQVYLNDHESRRLVLQEKEVPVGTPGNREVNFNLMIPTSSDSLLMQVEVLLLKGEEILDTLSADCPVPRKDSRGFYAGMAGPRHNRHTDRMSRLMFRDKYGLNLIASRHHDYNYAQVAKENFRHIEYTTNLGHPGGKGFEKMCITAPENRENFFPKNLNSDLTKVVPFRPLFYSLGEEHFLLKRSCDSPTCTAAFRKHLQQKYGSLAKLNEIWGTSYSSWDEVFMLTPEIIDMMKITFDVPQFENRRFMEHIFAERHDYLAKYIRRIDPLGEVGIHTGWDLWLGRGYDYWLLSKGMETMIGYPGIQNVYIRSFFKNYFGCWWHYNVGDQEDARWYPWYLLANGARGYIWFTLTNEYHGAVTADLHLSSDFSAAAAEFSDATKAGHLLVETSYQQDEVAIHYSQDSFQAGVGSAISYFHADFSNLLFHSAIPFRFVSYEQVEEGLLTQKKFRLFIMPHSISLSEKEISAVKEYVSSGGVLWADVIPGTYDEYGRKLEKSRLAELFSDLKEEEVSGIKIRRGTYGKGQIILGEIGNYGYAYNLGKSQPILALMDLVAQAAGIKPLCRIMDRKQGKLVQATVVGGYRAGNQTYLVVVRDYAVVDKERKEATAYFPGKAHVYEMRSGCYLGYTDRINTDLEVSRGSVFTLLPYRVRRLAVKSPSRVERGQNLVLPVTIQADGKIGKGDIHLLRVKVFRPDGQEITALRRLVKISGGVGEVTLPLAFNDSSGRWLIHLADTATGVSTEVPFWLR